MLDFGMPTLIETPTLEECAALCCKLGLDFIELNMNMPQYQVNIIDVSYFRQIAERYGIYYTIHLDENLSISDFNPYIAEAYRRTVTETIEIAKQLGTPILNMHLSNGVYFTLPERKVYLFDEYKEQYFESMLFFRDECERNIGKADVKICVENCNGYMSWQKNAITDLLESKAFGLTLDVGHNHAAGMVDEAFISDHEEKLYHIHMHDALGNKNHMVLGRGEVDLHKYFNIAERRKCRVVLETKTVAGLTESLEWVQAAKLK